jgi:Beta-propeller repeat/FG-GAP-like repeat
MAALAVACLAALPAWAERDTAAPNPDLGASVAGTPRPGSSALGEAARARVAGAYGKLPMSFEANHGQTDAQADFLSRGNNYSLFLTSTAAVAVLRNGTSGDSSVLRMTLWGANPRPPVEGQEALPGKSNYFIGNDPAQWHTEIPTFGRVKYGNVWPGIDLAYHGNRRQLEYDFIVAPHANPKAIKLRFAGARKMRVDRNGDLVLQLSGGELRTRKPLAYQEVDGVKSIVTAGYVVSSRDKVGIRLGAYDPALALVIDPTVLYSTYLGGNNQDLGQGIAVDAAGNAYVTGYTNSTDFPTTAGAYQAVNAGGASDAFVTKLDPAGSALVYSTYLGGANTDVSYAIAVDDAGDAYVTGYTFSSNFPTTAGAFQTTFVGLVDVFVTKLNPAGSALVYSTYLGGSTAQINDANTGYGITVDAAGEAYVTGATESPNFPTTAGAFQTTNGCGGCTGGRDAFVTKFNAAGSGLVYSTYLGGNNADWGYGIAVDDAGNAYVTGQTGSPNFPTTAGSFQPANGGGYDAFVTKLNPAGSGLVYSTYLGGSAGDQGNGIAVDDAGDVYVTGWTSSGGGQSTNFPTTAGAFQTAFAGGLYDAFVTKFTPAGSLVYSTYLGGSAQDFGYGIAVDAAGNAYVTGSTYSTDFPTTGAFQPAKGDTGGVSDVFVTKFNPTGFLLYSTYLGGNNDDFGYAIAVDAGGNAYVTGYTGSSDFPTTAAAFQAAPKVGANAFVTKFSLKPPVCCGDFNGDGRADILWRNASGEVYEWLLNGTNLIGEGSPGSVGNDWQIAGVGDFNGDGKADILWRNTS